MANDEIISYDILDWFPEAICENVFSHLDVADLKEASLVSKDWYNLIAKTSECMSKIRLVFGCHATRKLTTEMKTMLRESPRKYEHFSLTKLMDSEEFHNIIEVLESPRRKWKTCHLNAVTFPSNPVYISFMAALERTIEDIHMNEVYIDSVYSDIAKTMKFPKLRNLSVKHLSPSSYLVCIEKFSYFEIFANCENLISFDIQSVDRSMARMNGIREILINCKGLKMLSINTLMAQFFDVDISEVIKFQLNELHVFNIMKERSPSNLLRFLETQKLTVEKLKIGNWMDMEFLHLVTYMPRLKRFRMNRSHLLIKEDEWKDANFNRNTSIKTVEMKGCNFRTFRLEVLLGATPNLENLVLEMVEDDTLKAITRILPNLRSLETNYFEVTDVSDRTFLPKLERFTAEVYSFDLKVRNQNRGHFEDLVKTDMLRYFQESTKDSRFPLDVFY